jgi:DNA-binding transcriptional LysR family regulator
MDLRHLRTFVTVAEQGTVSKASVRLGIAQPALSRQIQDLEDELRIRLFDRIRRRLVLTGEGEQLLGHCRGILGAFGSLTEQTELLRRPDAGVLKVAATPQTIDGVLSVFLARYAKRRPNVQIKLTEAVGASLMAMLERGEVHVAISTAGAIQASNHSFETIWLPSLEFVAACNPALKLADGATIDVRSLASYPLLLLDSSFAVRAAFDAACRVAEFKPNICV